MAAAIPGIDSTPAQAPTTADPTGSSALGKDDFLKLLMAQLANQDPTAPTDNQAFAAQLAQFSSLEAEQGTNTRLDSLLLAQATSAQTAAVGFIGKQVDYRTDAINLQAGLTATSQGTLAAKADKLTVTIVDPSGRTVRTLSMGAQPAGTFNVAWDGNDDTGVRQPPGSYTTKATAVGTDGNALDVGLQSSGEATGLVFDNGVPELRINGNLIKMSAITSINERITP
jgi:flagellar basal-body rod modification protein FlgD